MSEVPLLLDQTEHKRNKQIETRNVLEEAYEGFSTEYMRLHKEYEQLTLKANTLREEIERLERLSGSGESMDAPQNAKRLDNVRDELIELSTALELISTKMAPLGAQLESILSSLTLLNPSEIAEA